MKIIVNTGNGKGKTSAAMGQVIRSLGQGFKTCIVQLFKSERFYGEQKILTKLNDLDFFSFAREHPYCVKDVNCEDVTKQCGMALKKLKEIVEDGNEYYLVILDEFNIALRDKFIDESEFITLVKQLSQQSNVVITGRDACEKLIDIADIVTEMREIKHSYNDGICAQKGIEY